MTFLHCTGCVGVWATVTPSTHVFSGFFRSWWRVHVSERTRNVWRKVVEQASRGRSRGRYE